MRTTTRKLLHKKSLVYLFFLFVLVFFLGNEWLLIFKSQPVVRREPPPLSSRRPFNDPSSFHRNDAKLQTSTTLPDGLIVHHSEHPRSWVHCVGENFLQNAWVLKSCQFEHLCWQQQQVDNNDHDNHGGFTLYPAVPRRNLTLLSPYARSSTDPWTQKVSLTATQPTWIAEQRHQWFPTVVDTTEEHPRMLFDDIDKQGFYELPLSTLWIPTTFDPVLLSRPSSILFDILLPIYTLATLFGFQDNSILLTPIDALSSCLNNNNNNHDALGADNDDLSCYPSELQPYLPLLKLAPHPTHLPPYGRLCARRAVAGMGALSDHGNKRHGERPMDYQSSHNVGRGASLWNFRRYLLQNANITANDDNDDNLAHEPQGRQRLIVFAYSTPHVPADFLSYGSHFSDQAGNLPDFVIQHSNLAHLSILEQIHLAVESTIWVAHVGEDSVPAFFLPRGGSLILFYKDKVQMGGGGKKSNRPAMLHWDIWNHASHLTVHWLPELDVDGNGDGAATTLEARRIFLQIIELQLEFLAQQNADASVVSATHMDDVVGTLALGEKLTWVDRSDSSSAAHCLGDNFVASQAPCYRSCYYRFLCLDVNQQEFQLSLSDKQTDLQKSLNDWDDGFRVVSTDLNQTLMEGRNVRFMKNIPWAPSVVNMSTSGFYALPDDVLWIPYYLDASFAGNPGHLFWDFLLPFYTLLAMYGHEGKKRLLLTSLDDECRSTSSCAGLVHKFLPLLTGFEIYSTEHLQIQRTDKTAYSKHNVSRICSRHAATGIGMLTEHGSTRHGQTLNDYQQVQNSGRGAHFYNFRSFMIRNMGMNEEVFAKRVQRGVLFSVNSSTSSHRRKSFEKQISATREGLGKGTLVHGVEFARYPVRDQLNAILQTSVLISTVGGSTATAMFLPRHSSLILYFSSEEDFVGRSRKKDFPTMMDFDWWNNAAYIRVHWLPTGSMDEEFHLEFLVDLVRSELAQTERFLMLE